MKDDMTENSVTSHCYGVSEVDAFVLADADSDNATWMFIAKHPRADSIITKIRRAATLLHTALEDAKKVFPDANYYVDNDSFHLMLGPSHDKRGNDEPDHQQRVVDTGHYVPMSGGDW